MPGNLASELQWAAEGDAYVGRLIITSVGRRDLAVVQCIVLLVATTMVLANLTVDLLYVWLDPRMRAPAKEDA